jgi:hypothetical protein
MKSNKEALKYLGEGEEKGINKWYKTSLRDEWQIVPSAWISGALFIRRNNIYPRLIINEAKRRRKTNKIGETGKIKKAQRRSVNKKIVGEI